MGIFSFIHKRAVQNYQRDLANLVDIYFRISNNDKRELADYFIFSVWTRAGIQVQGNFVLPNGGVYTSPELSYILYSHLNDVVAEFKKRGCRTEADAMSIWAHSANGVINAELETNLTRLWSIIEGTKVHWNDLLKEMYAEELKSGMDLNLLNETLELSKKILEQSPPAQYK